LNEQKHAHKHISLLVSFVFLDVTTADVVKNPRLVHARRRRDWFLRPELLREKVSRRAVREVYEISRREGESCKFAEEEEGEI
jgi:hypothetical protein